MRTPPANPLFLNPATSSTPKPSYARHRLSDQRQGGGDRITLAPYAAVGAEAAFTLSYTATGTVLASSVFSDGPENGAYQIGLEGVYSYGQFQLIGGVNSYYGSEVYSYVRVASHEGSSGADVLTAAIFGERVIGLDGGDTLISRQGDDLLDGSRGIDTADYRWATSSVTASLAIANPQAVGGGLGTDQLISMENLTGSLTALRVFHGMLNFV